MSLESDIRERIETDFGKEASLETVALLEASGITGRVARCIVLAASGSLDSLCQLIDLAEADYRDAIVAGEYDRDLEQLRDLRVSFLIDSPEKFWISNLALMLASRGCSLRSLTTRRATMEPFDYRGDEGEGIAEFSGTPCPLVIEKSNRKWKLHGDAAALEAYGLHEWFDDEAKFSDTVSGFILMGRRS